MWIGSQFAGPTAVSVYNTLLLAGTRERTERLQQALRSRAVIDQAIGIIRSRAGLSAEEAFERLTPLSQDDNVKVHRVAERLVEEAVRRARARLKPSARSDMAASTCGREPGSVINRRALPRVGQACRCVADAALPGKRRPSTAGEERGRNHFTRRGLPRSAEFKF
ncbi:MAG TPA: ANTAR domain-containing protein [Mycobacterium sp.]|nr:ANTAR domain-containing protein [Mycobacterium sp.]